MKQLDPDQLIEKMKKEAFLQGVKAAHSTTVGELLTPVSRVQKAESNNPDDKFVDLGIIESPHRWLMIGALGPFEEEKKDEKDSINIGSIDDPAF